jgi:outer membrane protein assembly factor BamB
MAKGRPTVFVQSAVVTPFTGPGVTLTAPPWPPCALGPLPACPDIGLLGDPQRAASLHAIDLRTGKVVWDALAATPTYAATTYANGVVYAPSTTQFGAAAYDADTGLPIWKWPVAASASSGTAITGSAIFVGGGTTDGNFAGQTLPPQLTGVWSFSPAG